MIITVSGIPSRVMVLRVGRRAGFSGLGVEAMVFQMSAKEGFEANQGGFGQATAVIATVVSDSPAGS